MLQALNCFKTYFFIPFVATTCVTVMLQGLQLQFLLPLVRLHVSSQHSHIVSLLQGFLLQDQHTLLLMLHLVNCLDGCK